MAWALLLDKSLRGRLERIREEYAGYRNTEMPSLGSRLLRTPRPFPAEAQAPRGPLAGFAPGGGRLAHGLTGAFAVLALCAVPWLAPVPAGVEASGWTGAGPDVIAKGRGLGVGLYVKGDSAYRVENHAARLRPDDTLQALPLGSATQHLALLGWDARQGLVRLFPAEGSVSRLVSPREPPPALLLQGMEESRLVCITSGAPFRLADAEALLRGRDFQPLEKAPAARLAKGLYVQVFSIAKVRGSGI